MDTAITARPPHQQRVIEEKADLDGRLERLRAFFGTGLFANLDAAERNRMQRQAVAMQKLSDILGERIEAFDA